MGDLVNMNKIIKNIAFEFFIISLFNSCTILLGNLKCFRAVIFGKKCKLFQYTHHCFSQAKLGTQQ